MKHALEYIEEIIDECTCGRGSFISVTGCGGKTSLIRLLSKHYARSCRTGVAASTKMYYPDDGWSTDARPIPVVSPEGIFYSSSDTDAGYYKGSPEKYREISGESGLVFYTDRILENGKIAGFGIGMQEKSSLECDIILIEADGSRSLPLKGWTSGEPVIPDSTSLIIGVLPMNVLGQNISEDMVFRYDHFKSLTGAEYGDTVDKEIFIKSAITEGALFGRNHQAQRLFFLNRCVNEEQRQAAVGIARTCLEFCDYIVAGSLYEDVPGKVYSGRRRSDMTGIEVDYV